MIHCIIFGLKKVEEDFVFSYGSLLQESQNLIIIFTFKKIMIDNLKNGFELNCIYSTFYNYNLIKI